MKKHLPFILVALGVLGLLVIPSIVISNNNANSQKAHRYMGPTDSKSDKHMGMSYREKDDMMGKRMGMSYREKDGMNKGMMKGMGMMKSCNCQTGSKPNKKSAN